MYISEQGNMFMYRNVDVKMKKNQVNAYVWIVTMYGSKIWAKGKTEKITPSVRNTLL